MYIYLINADSQKKRVKNSKTRKKTETKTQGAGWKQEERDTNPRWGERWMEKWGGSGGNPEGNGLGRG